ncbi:MAG: TIR domain-containing protein [Devosia sp.]
MDFQYKAFISYSHRDSRWAQWLLQALETYRLPEIKIRGIGKVFRDRDEAGAASDLKDEIQRALTASEHLIVIASPNSAQSKYVEAEIQAFAAANATREVPGKILTLIVAGEPNAAAGSASAIECFPPALRGGISRPDGSPFEPLAADARQVGDGRTRALAKLVAGLMDIRYDTLVRRDLIRRRRGRVIAIAASIAALVIAGIVGAVVISGNLEQERLRVASANAARETRTVSAVNGAERARRLLDAGNPAEAMALARQSLPLDDSVPFIPQAYDVMFRTLYDRAQDVDVDLAGYHASAPVVLPAGPGHYFVYNDSGTAVIWSTSHGVVYRRADLALSTRPSLSPDGAAIFVAAAQSMLRLALPDRVWSDIDLGAVFPNFGLPDQIVAVNNSTFYACRGTELVKISIDNELTGVAVWRKTLPSPCSALTIGHNGGAIAGAAAYAIVFDADGNILRTIGPAGEMTVQRVYATADAVILSHVGGTYIYPGAEPEPLVVTGRGMDYFALSPDGRWFVYSDADGERLVVNDLRDGGSRDIGCVCLFVGYYKDRQLMAVAGRTLEAYDLATLEPRGVIHTFSAAAETYAYLPDDHLLMALRQSGPESVSFLDSAASSTLLVDGTADPRTAMLAAAFTGTDHIMTREVGPGGVAVNLLSLPDSPLAKQSNTTIGARTHIALTTPLAGGKFVVAEDGKDGFGWDLRMFDGDSGDEVWTAPTSEDFAVRAGARFVGAQGDDAPTIYDAVRGATAPLPGGDYLRWVVAGDVVAAIRASDPLKLELFRLSAGVPDRLWAQTIESVPYVLCVAPEAGLLYSVRNTDGALQFERRSTSNGERLDALEVRKTTMLEDRKIRGVYDISCDASSLRLPGSPSQQWRWDVNAGALLSEAAMQVPPRDAPPLDSLAGLAELADGVIGWDDDGAWLYDPSADATAVSFASGGGRVSSSLYLADLGYVVLGLESGALQVWDVQHPNAPMIAVNAHTAPVIAVDYDRKRRLLLSADQEGTIHLWPLLPPEELLARLPTD